jgi:hypothetical protein
MIEELLHLPAWRAHAACRGQGPLFFASDPVSERIAVAICQRCGVRDECARAAAIEGAEAPPFGVRGGRTAAERAASSSLSLAALDR